MHYISLEVDRAMDYLMSKHGSEPHMWDINLRLDAKRMQ